MLGTLAVTTVPSSDCFSMISRSWSHRFLGEPLIQPFATSRRSPSRAGHEQPRFSWTSAPRLMRAVRAAERLPDSR